MTERTTPFKKYAALKFLALMLPALLLAACSSGQKQPEYYAATETEPLEIPDHLNKPDASQALVILSLIHI